MGMEEGVKDNADIASNLRPANRMRTLIPMRLLLVFLMFLVLALGLSFVSMHMIKYLKIQNLTPTTLIPACDERPTLESFIKPPSSVWHFMNDTELLWRASMEPRRETYPFKRVPKMAFMFLTRGPLPFAPLWERFFKGHEGFYSIYVHASPSNKSDFPSSSVFYRRHIPSQPAAWGEMSLCDAERRLLANALLDISNEWFILLSESCVPLRDFEFVYRYISRSRYSFMSSADVDKPYARGRYNSRMEPEVKLSQWRTGSQWFEINRRLAIDIVGDNLYYQKFKEFCKPPCYVDENYFQTMLYIRSPHLLANRTLTWKDWSKGGVHPSTFGKANITERLIRNITRAQACLYNDQPSNECFLFARKFVPSALEPLLKLSPKVLGF